MTDQKQARDQQELLDLLRRHLTEQFGCHTAILYGSRARGDWDAASDIDVIWIYGYGWPRHRGGPMHYADSIGLKVIRDRLREFEREFGDAFKPAALLDRLADEGKTFADYTAEAKAAAPARETVAA